MNFVAMLPPLEFELVKQSYQSDCSSDDLKYGSDSYPLIPAYLNTTLYIWNENKELFGKDDDLGSCSCT